MTTIATATLKKYTLKSKPIYDQILLFVLLGSFLFLPRLSHRIVFVSGTVYKLKIGPKFHSMGLYSDVRWSSVVG